MEAFLVSWPKLLPRHDMINKILRHPKRVTWYRRDTKIKIIEIRVQIRTRVSILLLNMIQKLEYKYSKCGITISLTISLYIICVTRTIRSSRISLKTGMTKRNKGHVVARSMNHEESQNLSKQLIIQLATTVSRNVSPYIMKLV